MPFWETCSGCGGRIKPTEHQTAPNGRFYHEAGAKIGGKVIADGCFPKSGPNSDSIGDNRDPLELGYRTAKYGHDVPAYQDREGPVLTVQEAKRRETAKAAKASQRAASGKGQRSKITTTTTNPKAAAAAAKAKAAKAKRDKAAKRKAAKAA